MKLARILTGIIVWIAGIGGLIWCVDERLAAGPEGASRLFPELLDYATTSRVMIPLTMERPMHVEVGDPIFVKSAHDEFEQIGEIKG